MDGWLIKSIKEDGTYDGRYRQYAWNRFLATIEEQKLKISDEEKQDVTNYIFQGVKCQCASVFRKLADKCLMEAQEYFGKK